MPKKTQESSHFGPNWPTQPRDFVRPVKWATLNCESDDDDFFFLRMAGGGAAKFDERPKNFKPSNNALHKIRF